LALGADHPAASEDFQGGHDDPNAVIDAQPANVEGQVVQAGVVGVLEEVVADETVAVIVGVHHAFAGHLGRRAEALLYGGDAALQRPDQADAQGGRRRQDLGGAAADDHALAAHGQRLQYGTQAADVGDLADARPGGEGLQQLGQPAAAVLIDALDELAVRLHLVGDLLDQLTVVDGPAELL